MSIREVLILSDMKESVAVSTNRFTRRILVPLDGSDLGACIYPHLRTLASVESQILLLGVVSNPLPIIELAPIPGYDTARRKEIDDRRAYLRSVARMLRDVTPHITILISAGMPADEILRIADEQAVDLILMPTHRRSTLGQLMLGSVSNRVVQASTVPVMLVSDTNDTTFVEADDCAACHRVVVPLDGSKCARAALPVAIALARTFNATIHLLRVVPTQADFFASRDHASTAMTSAVQTPIATSQAKRDAAYYEDYCGALTDNLRLEAERVRRAGVGASVELLIGEPVPSIVSVLEPGDIIVLASHGQGGVRHWPMGSVAEHLVASAVSPVVLVPAEERRILTSRAGTATRIKDRLPAEPSAYLDASKQEIAVHSSSHA